jgi:hypothetical protein
VHEETVSKAKEKDIDKFKKIPDDDEEEISGEINDSSDDERDINKTD